MIHSSLPLVTGVVDTLMWQRQILCGNLENPYVSKGASVWRLDRGMEVQWVYTVSNKQWEIVGRIHSARYRRTLENCK